MTWRTAAVQTLRRTVRAFASVTIAAQTSLEALSSRRRLTIDDDEFYSRGGVRRATVFFVTRIPKKKKPVGYEKYVLGTTYKRKNVCIRCNVVRFNVWGWGESNTIFVAFKIYTKNSLNLMARTRILLREPPVSSKKIFFISVFFFFAFTTVRGQRDWCTPSGK